MQEEDEPVSDYEKQRKANIEEQRKLFIQRIKAKAMALQPKPKIQSRNPVQFRTDVEERNSGASMYTPKMSIRQWR